jgi:hypothetical protein
MLVEADRRALYNGVHGADRGGLGVFEEAGGPGFPALRDHAWLIRIAAGAPSTEATRRCPATSGITGRSRIA